jgi:hypothetical protein
MAPAKQVSANAPRAFHTLVIKARQGCHTARSPAMPAVIERAISRPTVWWSTCAVWDFGRGLARSSPKVVVFPKVPGVAR